MMATACAGAAVASHDRMSIMLCGPLKRASPRWILLFSGERLVCMDRRWLCDIASLRPELSVPL